LNELAIALLRKRFCARSARRKEGAGQLRRPAWQHCHPVYHRARGSPHPTRATAKSWLLVRRDRG